MTCIISYTENNKVYIGGDRRISFDDQFVDSHSPKIIKSQSYMIGFAGSAGLLDLFKMIKPGFESWLQTCNLSYEEIIQYIFNILNFIKTDYYEIICSDGKRATVIDSLGTIIHDVNAKYKNLLVIGTGWEMVYGSFSSSSKINPQDKINEAIKTVGKFYPKIVGGTIDIFDI